MLTDPANEIAEWENYVRMDGTACYGDDMPPQWSIACTTPFIAWAVGSKGKNLSQSKMFNIKSYKLRT